jgi:GGDEF domain-containing protein
MLQTDPLTGFGTREELFSDLSDALEAGSPSSVFAVVDLAGAEEYRRLFGERTCDALIAQLAGAFARIVRPLGSCYRPRYAEFCALVRQPLAEAGPLLDTATGALRVVGSTAELSFSYGVTLLPDEARDPIEALIIADQQLDVARLSRERRDPEAQHGR